MLEQLPRLAMVLISAVLFGHLEQWIRRHGYKYIGYHWFGGKICIEYHLPLLTIWFLLCSLGGFWWIYPAYLVIEDASYFLFHPYDRLDPLDWINFGLRGVWIGGRWWPTMYLVGLASSAALYFVFIYRF